MDSEYNWYVKVRKNKAYGRKRQKYIHTYKINKEAFLKIHRKPYIKAEKMAV